jgi:glycosyltransferase involved in cell wall biosynthesis
MRILMLSYEFPPLGGGGGRVVHGLATQLVSVGHDVDVVTMRYRDLPERENVSGVNVLRVPCLRRRTSSCSTPEMFSYDVAALRMLRAVPLDGYAIIHTHFVYPDGLVALLARRAGGPPYLITAHGSDVPGYNPERFRILHRVFRPLWRHIARNAERIVCPSRTLLELVRRQGSAVRTEVIPNGFTPERLRPDRPKRMRILVVSRLVARKGVQYLFEAVDGSIDVEVHVVGDGPYLPELRRQAAAVDAPVRFWGWLDNDSPELRELYETSSIFALLSEAENFPVSLLEAMAAGQAVVTTRGTGGAEVVGDAGLLVAPRDTPAIRDTLRRLIGAPELRARLGAAARRRVEERFSWSAVAGRYVELYRCHGLAG